MNACVSNEVLAVLNTYKCGGTVARHCAHGLGSPVQVTQFCCVRVNFYSGYAVGGWWHETISTVTDSLVLFDGFNSSLY